MVDLFLTRLQENIAIVHENSAHLTLYIDFGWIQLSADYFIRVELHDPGLTLAIDNDDHVIGSGDVNYVAEVVYLVESCLEVTN